MAKNTIVIVEVVFEEDALFYKSRGGNVYAL